MSNRFIIFLAFFLSGLCLFAENDRDHIRRGNRVYRDSLYSKAQVEYQKAIEKDNANAIAHYNLGNALMYQNKAEDALKEYETATKFERNKVRLSQIYHNMGVLLQSAKQYDKALACYQNSLRNNPSCDETRYNYALCLYQLKKNPPSENDQNENKDENGKDEKKEQDKQQQEKKDQQNDQQQQQKPKQEQDMSKENAEQMLKAAMQDEKSTQEKMQRALQQPDRKRLQKQW